MYSHVWSIEWTHMRNLRSLIGRFLDRLLTSCYFVLMIRNWIGENNFKRVCVYLSSPIERKDKLLWTPGPIFQSIRVSLFFIPQYILYDMNAINKRTAYHNLSNTWIHKSKDWSIEISRIREENKLRHYNRFQLFSGQKSNVKIILYICLYIFSCHSLT